MNSRERRDLLGLIAAMPEEQIHEVLAFTREVLVKAKIDISYEWSEEDIEDLRRDDVERLERILEQDEVIYSDEQAR